MKISPFKRWRHYLAAAACLLVLALATPLFSHLPEIISTIAAGWGEGISHSTEITSLPTMNTESILEITSSDELETSDFNSELESDSIETTIGYLRYCPELEEIDEETMLKVKGAWAQLQYDIYYPTYFSSSLREGFSEEEAKTIAIKKATETAEIAFNHFFDSSNFFFYGYLGTIKNYVVLASYSNWTKPLNGLIIGDVYFGTQAIFYIYSNEQIISLEEAYENNLVSYEDLLLIKTRNEQYIDVAVEYYANQFREAQQERE